MSDSYGNGRRKGFCFTYNREDLDPEDPQDRNTMQFIGDDMLQSLIDSGSVSRIAIQWEKGEISGVPHIQGYIKCKTSGLRYEAAKALYPFVFEHCNFEQARASLTANIKYCTKERTRLMGPWTHNIESEQGKRNDLVNACDTLKKGGLDELIEEFPEVFVKYPQGFQKLRSLLLLKKTRQNQKI